MVAFSFLQAIAAFSDRSPRPRMAYSIENLNANVANGDGILPHIQPLAECPAPYLHPLKDTHPQRAPIFELVVNL